MSKSFSRDDSLENFEEFRFGHLAIIVLIDGRNELVHLILRDIPSLSHMFEGIIDKGGDLICLQSSTLILIIGIEHCIYSISQVVVTVAHESKFIILFKWKNLSYLYGISYTCY